MCDAGGRQTPHAAASLGRAAAFQQLQWLQLGEAPASVRVVVLSKMATGSVATAMLGPVCCCSGLLPVRPVRSCGRCFCGPRPGLGCCGVVFGLLRGPEVALGCRGCTAANVNSCLIQQPSEEWHLGVGRSLAAWEGQSGVSSNLGLRAITGFRWCDAATCQQFVAMAPNLCLACFRLGSFP